MGRKAKAVEVKLGKRIQVLFTPAEAAQVEEKAQAQGTTTSAMIRALVIKETSSMNNRNIWLTTLGGDADAVQLDLFDPQDVVVEDAEDLQDVE